MEKIVIEVNDELVNAIKNKVIESLAWQITWDVRKQLEDKVTTSIKTLDQSVINKMVTEYLVAEHIGKMKQD